MLEACVDQVAGEYGFGLLHSSARAEYTVRRIKRILCRSVWAMQEQIRAGSFRPKGFEISFKDGEDLDSVRMELLPDARMELQGRIDRIDTAEEEGNIYVKIVDYKSGNARFDPVAVYYGLQLQLLAYLNAALEMERKQEEKRLEAGEKEGRESEAKKVIPAGVFYCQLQDPVLEKEDGDSRETSGVKLLKAMRPQGNRYTYSLRALDRSLTTDSSVIPVSLKRTERQERDPARFLPGNWNSCAALWKEKSGKWAGRSWKGNSGESFRRPDAVRLRQLRVRFCVRL